MINTEVTARTLPPLQSNTAVVFGTEAIMKVLRRPFDGHHPDLEIPAELARAGSRLVAAPLGWIESDDTILAILSQFYPQATDAWKLAIFSLHQPEPDFSEQARTLGEATARLHAELADAFGASTLSEAGRDELTANLAGSSAPPPRSSPTSPATATPSWLVTRRLTSSPGRFQFSASTGIITLSRYSALEAAG